jgi:hypothetical protein
MGDFLQGIVAVFAIVLVSAVGITAVGGSAELASRLIEMGEGWRMDALSRQEPPFLPPMPASCRNPGPTPHA